MIENYCYGDDGYSMQQESYHAMQNEYNNNNTTNNNINSHHSSMQMMKPSSEYSKQNMVMQTESYGHGGHGGHGGYGGYGGHQNSFGGHNMYQGGYSGSLGSASNGYNNNHMSHTTVGPKPVSHPPYQSSMNAASHLGGGGGYNNTMMMSSTGYDNYNNKVHPGPMRVQQQTAPMGYGNGKWGTGGYYYNQSGVNCMPSNGHHSSEWISKSLDN